MCSPHIYVPGGTRGRAFEESQVQTINPIIIADYRPEWPDEFAAIAHTLQKMLGEHALRIDHIGSTAVPGLAAKNVIDVQVTVRDFTLDLEAAFERGGYSRLEYTHDHLPPTATGTKRDWEKQTYSPPPGSRRTNLHVRRAESANGRYALLFRDYLRTHLLAAAAYGQAKMALAQHGPTDYDLYYDVKDPVCDSIMAGAEDWAKSIGWLVEHYS